MLFDFLQYQNGIKENSIHATYLLYGQKKEQEAQADGDVEMGSSQPEHDAGSESVTTETLTLVAEESLKGVYSIYGLSSTVTNTMQQFSPSTRRSRPSTSTVWPLIPRKTSRSYQISPGLWQNTPQRKTLSKQVESMAQSPMPT
jgi:hypothetical protein